MFEPGRLRPRLQAAAIHLCGSAAVAALAAALVFWVWYPEPYAWIAGGLGLFKLVVSSDLVIGPLLTLVVFDPSKRRTVLVRDLGVLVVLQLAALGYGLHTMFMARPVALAFEGTRFRVVTVSDVLVDELPQALPPFRHLPLTGPRLVNTADPTAADKLDAISKALAGHDVGTRPRYWRPWDDAARRQVAQNAKSVQSLTERVPASAPLLRAALGALPLPPAQVGYLPVLSRFQPAVALVDLKAGDIVGYVPVNGD